MRFICSFVVWAMLFASAIFHPLVYAATIPAKDRIVVVISIDGFPQWMWEDQTLAVPTLRKLAEEGAIAKGMKVSNPSVTWINHTTLVTGVPPAKHGVLYNGLLIRQGPTSPVKIEQWRNKEELVRVPTVYDLAFKAGLKTAHVDWIPTTNSGTFTWEFPEVPNPKGKVELEMVARGLITEKQLAEFNKTNPTFRDMLWTRAGAHLITQHKPNLLLYHLLNTDANNHKFGPGSMASHTAYGYADYCVRELMDAIAAAGLKDKATIFIVTDHGFKTARRIIRPNVALKGAGLLRAAGPTVASCDAFVQASGGIAMVYITDPAKRSELTPKVRELLKPLEGVERILEPADYAELGMPSPKDNDQMGDFVLVAKPGYAFNASHVTAEAVTDVTSDVYPGHHGYLNTDPQLDGVFIASGYGIKRGAKLERVVNLDVAPTIAKVLGLEMKNVDGKPIVAALTQP